MAGGLYGQDVKLFVTGSGNTLWSYTDVNALSSSLSGTATDLTSIATAGTSQAFRGVVLVPVPEPTAAALLVAAGGAAAWLVRRRLGGAGNPRQRAADWCTPTGIHPKGRRSCDQLLSSGARCGWHGWLPFR